ncbi:DUF6504 family protein [Nonomuraea sp. JJY05]|uniref:DUF6504 family protein n=1 Tax=Nonomuraea sp. JJY05 TaxID=3350255 RepID=UPI00373ED7DF
MVDVVTEPADDPVFPLGRPVRFTWARQGRRPRTYRVCQILECWVTSREWWREDLPYEAPVDVWHYRVEASSDQGTGVLMLSVDVARERWQLDEFGR